ncbi:hypothetical protein LTR86_009082 [Recurvomyces mirabilis]|nr:hypothetical protein LTR86_009082 [Recurvomyces mirabilis]
MQLDNQLALAFGLITTILTLVGLLTKSAIIHRRPSSLRVVFGTNNAGEIHCYRQALQSSSSTPYPSVVIDLERQISPVTTEDMTLSDVDRCSAEATHGTCRRLSDTTAAFTALPAHDIRNAASSIDQVDCHNASTTEPRHKPTTTPPKHVSILTEAKLATHNNNTTPGTVDHPNHVESWLKQQAEFDRQHDAPDPQAWKELCRKDELAAEIEGMVKACRHEG